MRSDPSHAAAQPWRFIQRADRTPLPDVDLDAFAADIDALRAELTADLGPADLAHLRRMERWGRACSALGYGTAWIAPNPISALLIGLGNSARWTMITHHVLHRGYDRVPGTPARLSSGGFARGWRRWLDWPDWIEPRAWVHEHNRLHHFHTGEFDDPDLVEHNAWLLRLRVLPAPLKWLLIGLFMAVWKLVYYAPNTFWAWRQHEHNKAAPTQPAVGAGNAWRLLYPGERLWLPVTRRAAEFWLRCVLPYSALRFGLIPALFLPLGSWAWAAVLINSLIAEVITNIHTFVVIVPNHAGDDLYRFDQRFTSRGEFYLRQVVGSVNYSGGSDVADFLQGYLNYQIEHHVWPDLPMHKYRQAAPRLRAICARHGVPYIEASVFRRFAKLWAILTGAGRMQRAAPLAVRGVSDTGPNPAARPGSAAAQRA